MASITLPRSASGNTPHPASQNIQTSNICEDSTDKLDFHILIYNSMLNRAAYDIILLRLIAGAAKSLNGQLSRHFNLRVTLASPKNLVTGLIGQDKIDDDQYIKDFHSHPTSAAEIQSLAPDALIVSGTVPRENSLAEEAFYPELKNVIDFAVQSRTPSIFSCLAAQAYLENVYGVERRKLPQKLYGLFNQSALKPDSCILENIDTNCLDMAVSRGWESDESQILDIARNNDQFEIITTSEQTGASLIIDRSDNRNIALLTAHPEYKETTLAGEYDRDLKLWQRGAINAPPEKPQNYDLRCRGTNAHAFGYQHQLITNFLRVAAASHLKTQRSVQDRNPALELEAV